VIVHNHGHFEHVLIGALFSCVTTGNDADFVGYGTLPSELGLCTDLVTLDLIESKLGGTLPTELGQLTKLVTLELTKAQLVSTVPSELAQLTSLKTLMATGVKALFGVLPTALVNVASLTKVLFDSEFLACPVPDYSHVATNNWATTYATPGGSVVCGHCTGWSLPLQAEHRFLDMGQTSVDCGTVVDGQPCTPTCQVSHYVQGTLTCNNSAFNVPSGANHPCRRQLLFSIWCHMMSIWNHFSLLLLLVFTFVSSGWFTSQDMNSCTGRWGGDPLYPEWANSRCSKFGLQRIE
jgi:hypothetical protein